ncbi:CopD family protein [Phaeocystidibacter luteus]|uniref:Protoporphyrinogen IX oxidase n=1 Tax=Phaeocystidibacter luteus TaxID=911197 RepID=A0A6N6RGV6_9FLAO|nr:CopD family protein [Phaeocystidibacter luteus]KAB2810325.1 CopD family protein [Phaeocystidibacter luteus]
MDALYVRALHIIFVVTWFAGLFYMPRLFVYAAEANERKDEAGRILIGQYAIMKKRLWFGITWPSAILTLIFGLWMLDTIGWYIQTWLWVKLGFLVGLYAYHLSLHYIFKLQAKGDFRYSGNQMRIWNEVATIFLVAIIFLVELRSALDMAWGLLGLFGFIILLMLAIRSYKRIRMKKQG